MTREWFESDLAAQEDLGRLRLPRTLTYRDNTHATLDGRPVTVFCSNDYLGRRSDARLRRAGIEALEREAAGSGASRLVSGDLSLFTDVEAEFARFVGLDASLLFTSGFAANVGIVPSLVEADDVLFSDELNHASLVDGCRLARARTVVYPHCDVSALASKIALARPFRRGWIVTESVFSMDGDVAPLEALRALADREQLALYVDEAHGIGVYGEAGRGCAHAAQVRPDVLIGTLGKSLGGAGAFAAGSHALRLWLWNRARSFVFSTGASAPNAAMAREAIRVLGSQPGLVSALRVRSTLLRSLLAKQGRTIRGDSASPIVPIVIGDERMAVAASHRLLDRGFFVSAIRPPTVPRGTSRLRITVSVMHTEEEIHALAEAIDQCL
jgi:8-amino-7-oxononanoate synthase